MASVAIAIMPISSLLVVAIWINIFVWLYIYIYIYIYIYMYCKASPFDSFLSKKKLTTDWRVLSYS